MAGKKVKAANDAAFLFPAKQFLFIQKNNKKFM